MDLSEEAEEVGLVEINNLATILLDMTQEPGP
jgi:hypothetical protein